MIDEINQYCMYRFTVPNNAYGNQLKHGEAIIRLNQGQFGVTTPLQRTCFSPYHKHSKQTSGEWKLKNITISARCEWRRWIKFCQQKSLIFTQLIQFTFTKTKNEKKRIDEKQVHEFSTIIVDVQ